MPLSGVIALQSFVDSLVEAVTAPDERTQLVATAKVCQMLLQSTPDAAPAVSTPPQPRRDVGAVDASPLMLQAQQQQLQQHQLYAASPSVDSSVHTFVDGDVEADVGGNDATDAAAAIAAAAAATQQQLAQLEFMQLQIQQQQQELHTYLLQQQQQYVQQTQQQQQQQQQAAQHQQQRQQLYQQQQQLYEQQQVRVLAAPSTPGAYPVVDGVQFSPLSPHAVTWQALAAQQQQLLHHLAQSAGVGGTPPVAGLSPADATNSSRWRAERSTGRGGSLWQAAVSGLAAAGDGGSSVVDSGSDIASVARSRRSRFHGREPGESTQRRQRQRQRRARSVVSQRESAMIYRALRALSVSGRRPQRRSYDDERGMSWWCSSFTLRAPLSLSPMRKLWPPCLTKTSRV